ncbi:MAG: choice-of-anchor Q domain-containing protein [Acidimicrobiia bacterium]
MSMIRLPRRAVGVAASLVLACGTTVATFATFAATSSPAGAATTIGPVDPSIPDGGSNSLRDVLENQISSGDTVVLQAGATYTLDFCELPPPAAFTGVGDISVAAAVTIEGNGATIDQTCQDRVLQTQDAITLRDVTITGGNSNFFGGGLEVDDNVLATIDGVTFVDNESDSGGGIGTFGDLSITDSTFTNNVSSDGDGGGIQVLSADANVDIIGSAFSGNSTNGWGGAFEQESFDPGAAAVGNFVLNVSGSTFTGNTAEGDGGGALDTEDPATITVTDSTLDSNEGGQGGGIGTFNDNSIVSVSHSTLSNNTSHMAGGAIYNCCGAESLSAAASGTSTTIVDSTITGNHQAYDGAVNVSGALTVSYSTVTDNANDADQLRGKASGTSADGHSRASVQVEGNDPASGLVADAITLTGTVLAQPNGVANCSPTVGGTVTSNGYNFSDDASCNLVGTGDQQNAGDPGLGALANNGGPTLTRLPGTGSPLLDVVPPAACNAVVTDDQRGITRPQGSGCDVGAVEVVVEAVEIAPKFTG